MTEFFELLVNIPNWMDYLDLGLYKDDIVLKEYIDEMEREQVLVIEPGTDISAWKEKQNLLCEKLSIKGINTAGQSPAPAPSVPSTVERRGIKPFFVRSCRSAIAERCPHRRFSTRAP
jgi:hypothetical protein